MKRGGAYHGRNVEVIRNNAAIGISFPSRNFLKSDVCFVPSCALKEETAAIGSPITVHVPGFIAQE